MVNKLDQAHALIGHYQKTFEKKYGYKPILNRNKIKYLIVDILRDLKSTDFKSLIEFYIKFDTDPSLLKLCYEYAELWETMQQHVADSNERKQLLRDTEQRVKEFRERFGK